MKKILLAISFIVAGLACAPAFAGGACYSPVELQAEQLLRLHSELMVISLTCRQSSTGQDLISAYTGFTRNNIAILRDAEQTLIHYYGEQDGGNGIAELDRLRTKLGNEYSQKIADASAPAFCRQKRDRVMVLYYDTPRQIASEIHNMMASERFYGSMCAAPHYAQQTPPRPNMVVASSANYATPPAYPVTGLGVGISMDYLRSSAADLVGNDHSTNTNMRLELPYGADMDK